MPVQADELMGGCFQNGNSHSRHFFRKGGKMSMEDKKFIESIITDKWYRLQYAAERGENLAYLRGSFTGFCQMARLAMIVTDADIERCQQEAMARFENREE